jgi:chromosome segregation ATPase
VKALAYFLLFCCILQNFRSLLANLKFEETLTSVGEFVFGKILVAKSLLDAVTGAKLCKLTCVTLEGDKVEKNGPMTGMEQLLILFFLSNLSLSQLCCH